MRRFLALQLALCSTMVAAMPFVQDDDHITILDQSNIETAVAEFPKLVIEFYAPWCGHCQTLKPGYGRIGRDAHDEKWGTTIAKFDGSEKSDETIDVKKKYGVKSFPSLIFFADGAWMKVAAYEEDAIRKFLQDRDQDLWKVVTKPEEAEAESQKPNTVMGFFFPDFNTPEATAFKASALEKGSKLNFVMSRKMKVIKKFKVTPPAIMYFGTEFTLNKQEAAPEDSIVAPEGQSPGQSLNNWLGKVSMPVITELNAETAPSVAKSPIKRHLMAFVDNSENEEVRTKLKAVKQKFASDIIVVYIRVSMFSGLAEQFNVKKLPSFGIADKSAGFDRYVFDDEPTVPNLIQFVTDHKDKKLTAYVDSESEPEESDDPLKKIVGTNFRPKVVEDEEADYMVFFHDGSSPNWMMGELRDIAKKFDPIDTVTVATFDTSKNELLHGIVRTLKERGALPLVYMFAASPESKKNPTKYDGDIEVEEIISFMKKTLETVELETDGDDEEGEEEEEETGEEAEGDDEFEL